MTGFNLSLFNQLNSGFQTTFNNNLLSQAGDSFNNFAELNSAESAITPEL